MTLDSCQATNNQTEHRNRSISPRGVPVLIHNSVSSSRGEINVGPARTDGWADGRPMVSELATLVVRVSQYPMGGYRCVFASLSTHRLAPFTNYHDLSLASLTLFDSSRGRGTPTQVFLVLSLLHSLWRLLMLLRAARELATKCDAPFGLVNSSSTCTRTEFILESHTHRATTHRDQREDAWPTCYSELVTLHGFSPSVPAPRSPSDGRRRESERAFSRSLSLRSSLLSFFCRNDWWLFSVNGSTLYSANRPTDPTGLRNLSHRTHDSERTPLGTGGPRFAQSGSCKRFLKF